MVDVRRAADSEFTAAAAAAAVAALISRRRLPSVRTD